MTVTDELLSRKDALLDKVLTSTDPTVVNYLAQIAAIFNAPLPAQIISISNAQNSAAFMAPGKLNFASIGTTGTARNLKLQFTIDGGTTWRDTGIEVTTDASNPTRLSADDLAAIIPFCGRADFLRFNLDGADTVTIIWYSSN
jgi:hypothetical protein